MNLKEAFRYQEFLEQNMLACTRYLLGKATDSDTKTMTRNATPDDVTALIEHVVTEHETLAKAIGNAKRFMTLDSMPFDMDAALNTAKFHRIAADAMW